MSKNRRRNKHSTVGRWLKFERMESRQLLASDLFQHNFDSPEDVNGDRIVSPIDSLAIINHLNAFKGGSANAWNALAAGDAAQTPMFLDVNDDGLVTPMDALSIINLLNNSASKSTPADTVTTTAPATSTTDPTTTDPTTTDPTTTVPTTTDPTTTDPTTTDPTTTDPTTTDPTTTDPTTTDPTTTDPTTSDPTTSDPTTPPIRLVANLTGTGTERATVVFESVMENGILQDELEVRVSHSTPSSTLDVVVNDVTVGTVSTDANGNGTLQLSSSPAGASELPLPADFPVVVAAATVQIGTTLAGTLDVPAPQNPSSGHEGHGRHRFGHDCGTDSSEANETRFTALLAGTGSQIGYVQYEIESHRGTSVNELGISVNSLTPNASLDVIIDGVTVGQIQTDANGHGDLDLSSLPHNSQQLPLPVDFPTIAAGSTIQIGSELSGTFAAGTSTLTSPSTTPAAVASPLQRLTSLDHGRSQHRFRNR